MLQELFWGAGGGKEGLGGVIRGCGGVIRSVKRHWGVNRGSGIEIMGAEGGTGGGGGQLCGSIGAIKRC